jgi:hypothetical protein
MYVQKVTDQIFLASKGTSKISKRAEILAEKNNN